MASPQEAYHEVTKSSRPERRGVSRRSVIDAAKAAVPTIDLADRLVGGKPTGAGKWRRVGVEWVTNCLLPDHEDRVPSFTVNPEKDVWWCHGCLRGGDVVELARYAWGYEKAEVAMAAADLLREFGHPIPPRPATWYAKQERQRPVRNRIEAAKILAVRRRLYGRFFVPLVLATEDEGDRAHDEQLFWEATLPLAELLVANMMGR
jgi:hypothetical protein